MAHKLLTEDTIEPKKKKSLKIPNLGGKFGLSIFTGTKEVFIGLCVSEAEIEQVVRRRMVKNRKSKVQVLQFD